MLTSGLTTIWSQCVLNGLWAVHSYDLSTSLQLDSWKGTNKMRPCFAAIRSGAGISIKSCMTYWLTLAVTVTTGLNNFAVTVTLREGLVLLNLLMLRSKTRVTWSFELFWVTCITVATTRRTNQFLLNVPIVLKRPRLLHRSLDHTTEHPDEYLETDVDPKLNVSISSEDLFDIACLCHTSMAKDTRTMKNIISIRYWTWFGRTCLSTISRRERVSTTRLRLPMKDRSWLSIAWRQTNYVVLYWCTCYEQCSSLCHTANGLSRCALNVY